MAQDKRDLLAVLKFELAFLECGGYRGSARTWRPPLIFEDSPTCLNSNDPTRSHACNDCLLSHMAPREHRFGPAPCRFVSLNEKGETLDSLYRQGTPQELEDAVAKWLRGSIKQMEALAANDRTGVRKPITTWDS